MGRVSDDPVHRLYVRMAGQAGLAQFWYIASSATMS